MTHAPPPTRQGFKFGLPADWREILLFLVIVLPFTIGMWLYVCAVFGACEF